ncbi:hypothetical protein ACFV6F_27740 [Kitasatospora phosalacinea]|uniref:hypothetical protein n=1 Tax=Kitasatospora phosalacinea TaxID=2065 RepID=UPI003650266B
MTSYLDQLLTTIAPGAAEPRPRYDFARGRRRAAARLAAHQAALGATCGGGCPARQEPGAGPVEEHAAAAGLFDTGGPGPEASAVDEQGLTFNDHAERDLLALTTMVINEPSAYDWLVSLDSDRIDPRGGLVFACLLHLTGQPIEAQWWFQFAAGAGDRTATYCLYLHHVRKGELREAEFWFQQAGRLEDESHPVAIPPSLPAVPGYFATIEACQYVPHLPVPDRGLRDVLDHRHQVSDDMAGTFSLPPEDIAEHLHALTSG